MNSRRRVAQAGRAVGVLALILAGLVAASVVSGSALGQSGVLGIFMSDSSDPAGVGEQLTYDVTVDAAHFETVDVTETIPPGASYVDADSSCPQVPATQLAVCEGQIGGPVVYEFVVIPAAPGTLTNEASAFSHHSGSTVSTTESTEIVAVTSYSFTGFFDPVDSLPTVNSVKAGQAIAVKFSLGGDQGLDVFEAGNPKSEQIACDSSAAVDGIEETVTAGSSSLRYDAASDTYSYVWKTDKAWSSSCRQLVLKFADGSIQRANFRFG